jgi:hypothetical protein
MNYSTWQDGESVSPADAICICVCNHGPWTNADHWPTNIIDRDIIEHGRREASATYRYPPLAPVITIIAAMSIVHCINSKSIICSSSTPASTTSSSSSAIVA